MVTFKEWLKHKLNGMVAVQATQLDVDEDIDLTVFCWSGVQVNIRLVRQQLKPRAIKRILQAASQAGVNTLFFVNMNILPRDGERTLQQTWLFALHSLFGERIYTYSIKEGVPQVVQVHFVPIDGTQDFKAWYGPHVNFKQMRFYRQSVTIPSAIKGDWLVADFDDYDFWKNQNFQNYRATTKEQVRRSQTTWQSWSQTTWGDTVTPYNNPIQDYLESCYELLGLEIDSSYDEVKTAYRKLVKIIHPDRSDLPSDEANKQFHELTQAYYYIKASRGWD